MISGIMTGSAPALVIQAANQLGAAGLHRGGGAHEAGQGQGGQVADGRLLRRGELHDLRAQVAALDSAQVLLVGLAVAGVLVQHVGVASLHLHQGI